MYLDTNALMSDGKVHLMIKDSVVMAASRIRGLERSIFLTMSVACVLLVVKSGWKLFMVCDSMVLCSKVLLAITWEPLVTCSWLFGDCVLFVMCDCKLKCGLVACDRKQLVECALAISSKSLAGDCRLALCCKFPNFTCVDCNANDSVLMARRGFMCDVVVW